MPLALSCAPDPCNQLTARHRRSPDDAEIAGRHGGSFAAAFAAMRHLFHSGTHSLFSITSLYHSGNLMRTRLLIGIAWQLRVQALARSFLSSTSLWRRCTL